MPEKCKKNIVEKKIGEVNEYNREENTVYMTGPAKVSFTGKIEV